MTISLPRRPLLATLLAALMLSTAAHGHAATVEQDTLTHLNHLRAIRADQNSAATIRYNQDLDAAWKFFLSHKAQSIPVLAAQMQAELKLKQPNDLILLDTGLLLYTYGGAPEKALAVDALTRLDPESAIVRANFKELFDFTFAVARDHEPRVLPVIERAFLPANPKINIPQRTLKLDGTQTCVFLYGAYGPGAETALRAKLADPAVTRRVLEILIWLGSPAALPEVNQAIAAAPSQEMVERATAYMMQAAGPAGRDAVLNLGTRPLSEKSRRYLDKLKPEIKLTSLASARASLDRFPGDKRLSDAVVATRVAAMLKNGSMNEATNPLAIIDSGLAPARLIADFSELRRRTFARLSTDALSEVEAINFLINTLRYKDAAGPR